MTQPPADDDRWLIEEDEAADDARHPDLRPWRVLVVDDDPDVHAVTRLALRNVSFKERQLELYSAYSGAQGFQILRDTPDIALVLLDVVMESDDAGLVLARRIREELDNHSVRVVLRTGQPGQAPEQRVIIEYDINDYKAKTELTTQKLFTTVISSLRAYESLTMLERSRVGLGKILAGATNLYQLQSLRQFASGVLNQVSAILDVGADGVLCVMSADSGAPAVVAATGGYGALAESEVVPAEHALLPAITRAFQEKRSLFEHPANVLYIRTQEGRELCLSVTPPWPLASVQRDLLQVFCDRIASAFDNLYVFGTLRKAQEATVLALADLAEGQDGSACGHVRRVQDLATRVAQAMKDAGVSDPELTVELIDMIGLASILHDIGKVSVPPGLLNKPGRHDSEEQRVMRTHAEIGRAILARAAALVEGPSYLGYAAQIAGAHHEHWDGGGYPHGLEGRAIPLAARIVGAVDAFDALSHPRPYGAAWPDATALAHLREHSGRQFDPEVVAALLAVLGVAAR
jgi:response regulator RpfG family c-di-GMP phosphodiesterase